MKKTYLSALILAALAGSATLAFASGWDVALSTTESVRQRVEKPTAKMPVEGVVSSKFGMRQHPILEQVKMHNGIDIAAAEGTDFHSTSLGRVTYAGNAGSLGLMVEIKGLDGTVTRFGHASELTVKTGDRVHKGTVIGRVGSTGTATGSHLHYELIVNGTNINPAGSDLSGLIAKSAPAAKEPIVAVTETSIEPVVKAQTDAELKEELHNAALIASIVNSVQMATPSATEPPQPAVVKPVIETRLARLVPFKKDRTFTGLKRTVAFIDSPVLLPVVNQAELKSKLDKEIKSAIFSASV